MTAFTFFREWGFLVTNAITLVALIVWMKLKLEETMLRQKEHKEENQIFHKAMEARVREIEKEQASMDKTIVEMKAVLDIMYQRVEEIHRKLFQ